MSKESSFQRDLIKDLKALFPGCIVLKNDSSYIQGIPDLTVLYRDRWAMLECKRSAYESRQPNQAYYISKADVMSFGRFVDPDNKEDVLSDLQQSFLS